MKTKRFTLVIITILILCLTASAMLAGCGDKKDDASNSGSSKGDVLLTVDGADIKSASLKMVGETPNLMVVFANNTDKEITIEAGKFSVKTSDGETYSLFESNTVLDANKSYIQHSYTAFKGDPAFKAGDSVEIYYDGTLLDSGEIETFG